MGGGAAGADRAAGLLEPRGTDVQNHMREDMFTFAIPAFFFFTAGLATCGWDFVTPPQPRWPATLS